MITMSLPGILGMMLISVNALIDAVYVGQLLGEEALAGISLALPLTVLTTALTAMVASGSASVLSRAIGAQDTRKQKQILSVALNLSLISSLLLSIIGYWLADALITFMGGKGAAAGYGVRYYQTLIVGAFFSILGVSSNSLIRAEGKIKRAMMHLSMVLLLNIMATPLFIVSLGMGVAGAALGTIISMGAYTMVNLSYLLSGKASFDAGKLKILWRSEMYGAVLAVGLSALALQVTQFIRQLFIFKSMAHYGTMEDVAFLGAVFRIFMFSVMPVFGMVQAMQPVTGINFGAKNYERSIQSVKVFRTGGFLLLVLICMPSWIFPQMVLSSILPGIPFPDEDIYHFRVVMLCIPCMPLASTGITFFQAIGNSKMAGLLPIMRNVLLFVPVVLAWPYYAGKSGIYYTICAENIAFSAIVLFFTWYEFKKLRQKVVVTNA